MFRRFEDLVLIFNGRKRFDGNIHDFEKILGVEKNISFNFKSPVVFDDYLNQFDPKWNENNTVVSLRVPLQHVQEVGIHTKTSRRLSSTRKKCRLSELWKH